MFEVIVGLTAIAVSLVIYFKFVDKNLDKLLDKIFVSWHEIEIDDEDNKE